MSLTAVLGYLNILSIKTHYLFNAFWGINVPRVYVSLRV